MDLKLGDRLADERGEWQGKTAHVRVELIEQPGVTDIRTWSAHEKVSVKRA